MKKFLNVLFASVMALMVAASCAEKPTNEEPQPEDKGSAKFEFVNAPKKAEFEFGQTKTFAVKYSDIVEFGVEQPEGWTALLEENDFVVTAPAEGDETAELEGDIVVRFAGEDGVESVVKLPVYVNVPEIPVPPAEPITFELIYSNVTTTVADLQVIPSDDTAGYYLDVCTEEDCNRVNGDV